MGKKKQPAKSEPPAPAEEDLATLVLCVQQHQPKLYEAITARGREQPYDLVKATIARTLEKGRASIFEEGRREGYDKGLRDGEEKGRTDKREKRKTKHESEDAQTEPTKHAAANSSTQTPLATTVDA